MSENKNVTVSRSLAMNRDPLGAVIVTKGEHLGKILSIRGDQVLHIGKDASQCDLVFSDSRVSRVHLMVQFDREAKVYKVTDCKSTNGTAVNDKEMLEPRKVTKLKAGTRLLLGCREVEITLG